MKPNLSDERDRIKAALWGSLRGFAALVAPHLALSNVRFPIL